MPVTVVDGTGGQVISSGDLSAYLAPVLSEPIDPDWLTLIVGLVNGAVTAVTGVITGLPSTRLQAVALEVGARAYRNSDGFSSETVDDYTYRRDSATRTSGVYLTPDERAELLAAVGRARRTSGTVRVRSPLDVP